MQNKTKSFFTSLSILFFLCTQFITLKAKPDMNSTCITNADSMDYILTDIKYNKKKSDFSFCFASQNDPVSKTRQCFIIKNLRDASNQPNELQLLRASRKKFANNLTKYQTSGFGSQLQQTKQAELKLRQNKHWELCERSYIEKPRCAKVRLSNKIKKILGSNNRINPQHLRKNTMEAFWNSELTGLIVYLKTKEPGRKFIRKLIVARKVKNKLSYLYQVKIKDTGLDFASGYFRNDIVFINDCTAGPACILYKQTNKKNRFKNFPLNGHDLQEIVLYHDKVLIMNFDGSGFVLYNDKTQKIEKLKLYNKYTDASIPASLIRLENQFLVIYQGRALGRIDTVDPVTLQKTMLVNINNCNIN